MRTKITFLQVLQAVLYLDDMLLRKTWFRQREEIYYRTKKLLQITIMSMRALMLLIHVSYRTKH